jgi:hypothetical protein
MEKENPFALSLSKSHASCAPSWFDRLTANGKVMLAKRREKYHACQSLSMLAPFEAL